jgi:hypothetical protein
MPKEALPKKKKRTTPDEFNGAARKEFGYLVTDYGYEEDPDRRKALGPRSICFVSPVAAVTVEGFPITMSVSVTVTCNAPEGEEQMRIPLSAIVDQRAPEARSGAMELLAQLARDAALLRQHAHELLRGEEQARKDVQRLMEKEELRKAMKKAVGVAE